MQFQRNKRPVSVRLATLLAIVTLQPCYGFDMLLIKGNDQPIFGRVVESSETRVEFQVVDEKQTSMQIDAKEIEVLIVNYDEERLSRLNPERMADYLKYAEELSAQKKDPVARRLAIRLYIIVAANGSPGIQQSAVAGLSDLADNEVEWRKWSTLNLLIPGSTKTRAQKQEQNISKDDNDRVLELVRAIRREEVNLATELFEKQETRMALRHWAHVCDVEELARIVKLNRPTTLQLAKLLKIEVAILDGKLPDLREDIERDNWSSTAYSASSLKGAKPNFRNATDFDPAKTIYRDGKWQVPTPVSISQSNQ